MLAHNSISRRVELYHDLSLSINLLCCLWYCSYCLAGAGSITRWYRYMSSQRVTSWRRAGFSMPHRGLWHSIYSRWLGLCRDSNLTSLPRIFSAKSLSYPLTFLAPFNPLTFVQLLSSVRHWSFLALYIRKATYRQSSQSSQSAQLPSYLSGTQKPVCQTGVLTSGRIRIECNRSSSSNHYSRASATSCTRINQFS